MPEWCVKVINNQNHKKQTKKRSNFCSLQRFIASFLGKAKKILLSKTKRFLMAQAVTSVCSCFTKYDPVKFSIKINGTSEKVFIP